MSIPWLTRKRNLLLLEVLQNFVSIVLNTSNHVLDKGRGLSLEEPAQSNNALRDSTQMVKQRRSTVRLSDVVDAVRCLVKICHELNGVGLGLLGLGCDEKVGTLGLECLQNGFGLLVYLR